MDLGCLISNGKRVTEEMFSLVPERSTISTHDFPAWLQMLFATDSEPTSHGMYIPAGYQSHVWGGSPYREVNALHEFFGHGLFFEQKEQESVRAYLACREFF